jgi:threonine/homoserine/homoserine lactone efflux protein
MSAKGAGMSIDFLLTSLIVVVSPGTGVLFTLAAGLSRGARASVVAAFGCTLGIVPHMAAAITGLAALLHTSALAFQVLKYLGVAYLLYMAWNTLREQGALRVEKEIGPRSASRHPDQSPESEALDFRFRFPAAVREPQ